MRIGGGEGYHSHIELEGLQLLLNCTLRIMRKLTSLTAKLECKEKSILVQEFIIVRYSQ